MDERELSAAVVALAGVMKRLRADCPWDAAQSHASLRTYLLEECHEVLAALDDGDRDALRGELGDLVFQVFFHAEIASETAGGFDLADVLDDLREKLVRRHPHVFGDAEAADAGAVQRAWERRKLAEGRRSRLDGIPAALPALARAQAVQRKAALVGFTWREVAGALDKIREEAEELVRAAAARDPDRAELEHELGDLLFSVVNVARYLDLDAESALRAAVTRFSRRFARVEESAGAASRALEDMSLEDMDRLWEEAKRAEREERGDAR